MSNTVGDEAGANYPSMIYADPLRGNPTTNAAQSTKRGLRQANIIERGPAHPEAYPEKPGCTRQQKNFCFEMMSTIAKTRAHQARSLEKNQIKGKEVTRGQNHQPKWLWVLPVRH